MRRGKINQVRAVIQSYKMVVDTYSLLQVFAIFWDLTDISDRCLLQNLVKGIKCIWLGSGNKMTWRGLGKKESLG